MKLIYTLQTLDISEWKEFRKFTLMNHREESDLYALLSCLYTKRNTLEKAGISDEIKKKYFFGLSQKYYLNLYSTLYRELQNWMVYQSALKSKIEKEIRLVKCLNDRGLYKDANSLSKKLEHQLTTAKISNTDNAYHLYSLLYTQYFSDNPIKYRNPEMLEKLIQNHLINVNNQSLLLNIEADNWGKIRNIDFTEFKHIFSIISTNFPSDITTEDINQLNDFWFNSDLKSFKKIYHKIINFHFGKSGLMLAIILAYTIVKYTRLWVQLQVKDSKVFLELYNFGFEFNLLFPQKKIPVIGFFNTLSALSSFLDKSNVLEFMENFYPKVKYPDLHSIKKLSSAIISFHYEDYEGVIDNLKTNLYFQPNEKLRAQGLLLIAYSELGDAYQESFFRIMDNFKRQLRRNKPNISGRYYLINKNLIKFLFDNYQSNFSKKNISITNYSPIIYRSWVQKKIKQ